MKRFVSVLLCIVMLLCMVPAVMAAEEEGIGVNVVTDPQEYSRVGQSDDVYTMAEKVEDNPPHTYEAWVKFPVDCDQPSVIFGNGNEGYNDMSFEITAAGNPLYYWQGVSHTSPQYSITFTKVNVFTGKWLHLAITHDAESGFISLYVNGELAERHGQYPDYGTDTFNMPLCVIGDNDYQNHPIFQGRIKQATLYADARTAEEVYADYKKGADLKDPDLIGDYSMTSDREDQDIPNNKEGGIGLLYSNNWLTEAEMEELRAKSGFERAYSFAVIGDIQYSSEFYPESLPIMHQWIVDNADDRNIVYYINAGDITNRDTAYEWENAKAAISLMDGIVPYSLVRGNHDIKNHKASTNQTYHDNYCADIGYATTTVGASLRGHGLDTYFGTDDPDSNTDYVDQFKAPIGGRYEESTLINTWTTFEAGSSKYLVMNLDYGPSDKVLKWAGEVVAAHPDHKVIFNTHCYMISSGAYSLQDTDEKDLSGILIPDGDPQRNTGYGIWQKLVSQYENVEMMICGHVTNGRLAVNQREGVHGNTVTEMLVCPQVYDNRFRGLGMIAMYYFNEDGSEMDVEFYSAVADRYYKGFNQFHLDLEAEGEDVPDWIGYPNVPAGSGTAADPYLIADAGNLVWMSLNVASSSGKYFLQTADIDLAGLPIRPIGDGVTSFAGKYDGNGYTIKNGDITGTVAADGTTTYGYGLFGALKNATVSNVTLEDVTVIGRGANGMIAGIANNSSISNCYVKESAKLFSLVPDGVTTFTEVIGGLVGVANAGTTISASVAEGNLAVVDGATSLTVGGLVGTSAGASITDCYSNMNISYIGENAPAGSVWSGVVGSGEATLSTAFALRNLNVDLADATVENGGAENIYEKAAAVKAINSNFNKVDKIYTEGDWTYTVNEDGATITEYAGNASTLEIPATLGGNKVVALGDALFCGAAQLTAVTIPESVTSIGVGAFSASCITEVTIPKNVKDMDGAFAYATSLTKVTIENGVTTVGYNAFGNTGLTDLYIPDSVKTVEGYAFGGCTTLTLAEVAKTTAVADDAFEVPVSTVNICGDVNSDDTTDLIDALLLLRKMSGNLTAEQENNFNLRAANVYDANDADNEVNSADVIQMLRVLSGAWENGKPVQLTRSAANPTFISVN